MAPERAGGKRVRRGEAGELTQWPRGLVGYTPVAEAPDRAPDPSEERTTNRIHLAARLIAVRRAAGGEVGPYLVELRGVEWAHRVGRGGEATRRLERLLGELGPAEDPPPPAPTG